MRNSLVYLLLFVSVLEEVVSLQNRIICSSIILKNGRVRRRQRGRFVKFACNNGYLLAGERHSTCTHGQWDPPPPKCVRPTCANKVKLPNNGLIYPSHNGAALHFFCKAGYELRGPAHVYCDGSKWDNNVPTCIPSSSKPALFCDFEDEYLCGWTHDLNHDFDWRRENYNTPSGSIGTGPSFDHTKGLGYDGYYMYIESSSRNENDTARLISPVYDKSDGDICFQFFYHMFGATTGSLRVYLKSNSSSWDLNPNDAFFSMSGNQGDRWYRSFHMLGIVDKDFQIVIEGVRGHGYVSDIAIDDVKLIENCTDEEYTTTEESNTIFTEVLPIVDSCFNRCGERDFSSENHIACDCNDDCFDNNKCCPDYFDYCILTSTSESSYTVTDISNDIDENVFQRHTTLTNFLPETSLTPTTEAKTRSSVILPSTDPTSLPIKNLTSTTILPTTPKKLNTQRPIIRIQTRPTTQIIIRKIIPSVKPKTSTLAVFHKKPLKPGKEIENDVIDLPMPKDNDKALLITSPFPDDYFSKEYWSNEEENDLDKPYFRNINENTPLFRLKKPESEKNNFVLVTISAAGIFVLTIIAFFTIKRYRSPRSRINCSNGDSQSDVRYLRESELLNFSLAQDYDNL